MNHENEDLISVNMQFYYASIFGVWIAYSMFL